MTSITRTMSQHILTLTLSRPEKKNALTRGMYQALADEIDAISHNRDVKVILLKGEGGCFTAGNDISDFARQDDQDHIAETAAFMRALADCEIPVVAQVEGLAVGIGTTLLLHCDLVYCAPKTQFVLPFINLGLVPEYASSYLLPRLAGHRKASEWLMLGEPFGAEEAQRFGLVNAVIDDSELADSVFQVCVKLTQKPVYSLKQTKRLLKFEQDTVREYMNEELDVFLEALKQPAAQEAFDAFLKKRPINPEKFQ